MVRGNKGEGADGGGGRRKRERVGEKEERERGGRRKRERGGGGGLVGQEESGEKRKASGKVRLREKKCRCHASPKISRDVRGPLFKIFNWTSAGVGGELIES